jgi:RNA polymerase sigma factor (sigma-70 family)
MEVAHRAAAGPLSLRLRGSTALLLRGASDEGLAARVRAGNEGAFGVLYERHHTSILAFCRHMLGSREEAEDVVQQTFIAAYRDMQRNSRDLQVRAWLFKIARNQCIDALRRRRPQVELEEETPSFAGLPEQVARRGDLRELLADLARLPFEQREALVLSELHDNSHSRVAEILGCDTEKVKSLVFQARTMLIKRRDARELDCREVQHQLSTLRGSALRRGALGAHVHDCDACKAFAADVKRQRQQVAILLAVIPTAALKLGAGTALAAAGGSAGRAAGTGGGSAAGGSAPLALGAGKLATPGLLLKAVATVTSVCVLATGGFVGMRRVSNVGATATPAASTAASSERAPTHTTRIVAPASAGIGAGARAGTDGTHGGDTAAASPGQGEASTGGGQQGSSPQAGGDPTAGDGSTTAPAGAGAPQSKRAPAASPIPSSGGGHPTVQPAKGSRPHPSPPRRPATPATPAQPTTGDPHSAVPAQPADPASGPKHDAERPGGKPQ